MRIQKPPPQRISVKCLYGLLTDFFEDDPRPQLRALEFMRAFSPCVLAIPSDEAIERLARDEMIVTRLRRDASKDNIAKVARFHGVAPKAALKALDKANGVATGVGRRKRGWIRDCYGQLMFWWTEC